MEVELYNYICNDCPRKCSAIRSIASCGGNTRDQGRRGYCGGGALMSIVRAAPHYGEEPCISGTNGSGAVFFEGCNLRCVFCQNFEISRMTHGSRQKSDVAEHGVQNRSVSDSLSESAGVLPDPAKLYTTDGLRKILLRLRDTGVHNINLVTPTHYTRQIAAALDGLDLGIPIVWNSSGYESVETLKRLEGLVQIYMPDYKYASRALAKKYSAAEDYPERAAEAIREMFRQTGAYRMDGNGILRSGVLIRHLVLPGGGENTENSMDVIDFVADTFPEGSVLFSLMSQYTPMPAASVFPELRERVAPDTMELLKHYLATRHLEDGYYQEEDSATGEMIPEWDGTGLV